MEQDSQEGEVSDQSDHPKDTAMAHVDEENALVGEDTPLLCSSPIMLAEDEEPEVGDNPISPHRILVPFLLYSLAVGAVAVPKINIILALMCGRDNPKGRSWKNITTCKDKAVYAEMGRFVGCGNLISGILSAVSSPCLGVLSDRYGRRPLIAFSAVGMFSGDVVSVLAAWFPDRIPVYWILLEFVIGGLTGAFFTTVGLIQSYITDITPLNERSRIFSLLHAYLYLGLALGPAAGAFLVRNVSKDGNMLLVFYVAGACHALFISYILVGLPDPASRRGKAATAKRADQVSSSSSSPTTVREGGWFSLVALSILRSSSSVSSEEKWKNNSKHLLPVLATIDALSFGVQIGLPPLLVLFSESNFQWTNFEANMFISAINTTRAVILAIILPTAVRLMSSAQASAPAPSSPPDRYPTAAAALEEDAAAVGQRQAPSSHSHNHHDHLGLTMTISRLSLLLILFSNVGFVFYGGTALTFTLSGLLSAAGAPISPLMQSSMTNYVRPDRIGELFGAIGLLHAVSRALVPALMQYIYSLTLKSAPTALFAGLGALFGLAFLLSLRIKT